MKDITCLAEGYTFSTDSTVTGHNLNEIVVGSTGSGKTASVGLSRIIHTFDTSIFVPISKKSLKKQCTALLEDRGYEVYDLNFSHPGDCTIGYDYMDYIHSDEDVIQTAKNLVVNGRDSSQKGSNNPYWDERSISLIAAEIGMVRLNAEETGTKPCFVQVVRLHMSLKLTNISGIAR